jgi:hypothetical protein
MVAAVTGFLVAALLAPFAVAQSAPVATLRSEARSLQADDLQSHYALLGSRFHKTASNRSFRLAGRKSSNYVVRRCECSANGSTGRRRISRTNFFVMEWFSAGHRRLVAQLFAIFMSASLEIRRVVYVP